MADEAKTLGQLRAEHKELTGKAPSPKLDAAALQAKIDGLKAAAGAPPAQDPPADGADAKPEAAAKAPEAKPAKPAAAKADDEPAAPEGTVYLAHPEGIGCSFRGVELKPDKKGRVLAPASAAEELAGHGFQAL